MKKLTTGGCLLTSLPTAGKQLLFRSRIWAVHLCIYHECPRWLSLIGYRDSYGLPLADRGKLHGVTVIPELHERKIKNFQRENEIPFIR